MTETTIPEVFILESLHPGDPKEGKIIKKILEMGERNPKYCYIKTKDEFNLALQKFSHSNYRYLHISSHGNRDCFGFEFGEMYFNEFHGLIHNLLQDKRVFISACELVNHEDHVLANLLLRDTGCYSVIGSYEPINFDDAVMFWSNFYFLAYHEQNDDHIKFTRKLVIRILQKLTGLYHLNMNYYSYSKSKGIKLSQFKDGGRKDL
jgi:hypothetical protein